MSGGKAGSMRGFALGYERLCRIVLLVFVVNVAFVAHALAGLVVVGLFPSISASYATYRTWALDADQSWGVRRSWTVFHRAWRDDVVSANAFGWPQMLVVVLLLWDYFLANSNAMGVLGIAVSGILLLVNVLVLLICAVSWVVRSNFDERPWWVIRMSVAMVIARPLLTVIVAALVVTVSAAWIKWPGILMTFGLSVPIFLIVMAVYSFGRLPGMDAHEDAR